MPLSTELRKPKKNIVICMDGTGNRGGKTRGTNVWRIFNSVDRHRDKLKQITYYDDGVGSDGFRLLRLFAGAFGIGLSRKIRDAYTFLVENHEQGDRIYLFGFSRGAFAARSLAGMICRCGLLERESFVTASPRSRARAVRRVLNAYRSEKVVPKSEEEDEPPPERIRQCLGIRDLPLQRVEIHFIGVWDTVDAVGGTLGGLSALDWLWQTLFRRRWWGFHDLDPHPDIRSAFQALALDDERRIFHPKVWDRPKASGERPKQIVQQVWFAGAHANVGGGYPKDSLSLIPLLWMMYRAHDRGLRFLESKWVTFREAADPHGRLYDSRAGFAAFYQYARRNVHCREQDPAVHSSVFERVERGTDQYAPKALGKKGFVVVPADDGRSTVGHERLKAMLDGPDYWSSRFAKTRARLYWLTMAFWVLVICLLCFVTILCESSEPLIAWPVELVGFFMPGLPANVFKIALAFPVPALLLAAIALLIGRLSRRTKLEEGECAFRSWAPYRSALGERSSQDWKPALRARVTVWMSPAFLLLSAMLAAIALCLLAGMIHFASCPNSAKAAPLCREGARVRLCCAKARSLRLDVRQPVRFAITMEPRARRNRIADEERQGQKAGRMTRLPKGYVA